MISELKQKYTQQISHSECRPMFNHQYALKKIKQLSYKTAVCSNSIRNTIETMLSLASIDNYFDLIISNQDVQNSKPAPDMYLEAMKRLDLEPKECLIIEDNENGIKAAKASGGHLMIVNEPNDVTLENIKKTIKSIEGK